MQLEESTMGPDDLLQLLHTGIDRRTGPRAVSHSKSSCRNGVECRFTLQDAGNDRVLTDYHQNSVLKYFMAFDTAIMPMDFDPRWIRPKPVIPDFSRPSGFSI